MNEKPIFVLRHGQTEWNSQGRLQGHADSPLTAHGRLQARLMGATLASLLDASETDVVVSPLGRALQTAEIVMSQLKDTHLAWRTDERLREIGVGQWQGLTRTQVAATGKQFSSDRDEDWFLDAPEAETLHDFTARIASFLKSHSFEKPLVVVCHGQTGMILRGLYLGLAPRKALALDQPQDAFYRLAGGTEERIPSGEVVHRQLKDRVDEIAG